MPILQLSNSPNTKKSGNLSFLLSDIGLRIEKTNLPQFNHIQETELPTPTPKSVLMTVSFKNVNPFSIGVTVIVSYSCEVHCEVLEQSQDSKVQKVSVTGHAIRNIEFCIMIDRIYFF